MSYIDWTNLYLTPTNPFVRLGGRHYSLLVGLRPIFGLSSTYWTGDVSAGYHLPTGTPTCPVPLICLSNHVRSLFSPSSVLLGYIFPSFELVPSFFLFRYIFSTLNSRRSHPLYSFYFVTFFPLSVENILWRTFRWQHHSVSFWEFLR